MNEAQIIGDYCFSIVREQLNSPMESYTKWFMLPNAVNGILLNEINSDDWTEVYLLNSNSWIPEENEILFPIGEYQLLICQKNNINSDLLNKRLPSTKQDINRIVQEYESRKDIRSLYLYFDLERHCNTDKLKQILQKNFPTGYHLTNLYQDSEISSLEYEISDTFNKTDLIEVLSTIFTDCQDNLTDFGFMSTKSTYQDINYTVATFRSF